MLRNNKKGFTLIELIMVIVIIGILAAIAIPTFSSLVRQAKEGATRGALGAVRSALAIAYAKSAADPANGGIAVYPAALTGADFADGQTPLNALTGGRGIDALGAIPGDLVTTTGGGFWYVAGDPNTVPNAGRSGAYVDKAYPDPNLYQDDPTTW